jgi:hypothetical protein
MDSLFSIFEESRSVHIRNTRGNAVNKGLDLGNGERKTSFWGDIFFAFNCAGKIASPE